MKRVLCIGDTHCGHVVGLTPPVWQYQQNGEYYHDKYAKIQRQMWEWFVERINAYKPIDRLIFNGDAIEGKGKKSGGTELLTSSMLQQGEMVDSIIQVIQPEEMAMTYGTAYHVGNDGEDFELLFTLSKENFDKLKKSWKMSTPITAIGEITASGLKIISAAGTAKELTPKGFDHIRN